MLVRSRTLYVQWGASALKTKTHKKHVPRVGAQQQKNQIHRIFCARCGEFIDSKKA